MTTTWNVATILEQMGLAGRRLDEMHAVEASAGNLSFAIKGTPDLSDYFDVTAPNTPLPLAAPSLVGYTVFVTGSGCRLRDVLDSPRKNVSAFVIEGDGSTGTWLYNSQKAFTQPTSEFNSHLAVHADQVDRRGVEAHAVIHAQPPYLVQLSHEADLRSNDAFNRAILRWEPETIVQLPDGIEVLEFMVPGSDTLMENNVRGLREHQITLWSKHGIMVRSDQGPLSAVDKTEYAETGAMYEIRNRMAGGHGEGLHDSEIKAVISAFNVKTSLFS